MGTAWGAAARFAATPIVRLLSFRAVAHAPTAYRSGSWLFSPAASCIGKVKGKTIAPICYPAALEEQCRLVDTGIAPFNVGKAYSAARVLADRRPLQAEGAYTPLRRGLSIRSGSVVETRGRRPWMPKR